MQTASVMPLACFLSLIRPPGVEFENSYLQMVPIDKAKCPYMKGNNDVGIRLYTRYNPIIYHELLLGDDEKLASSHIDFADSTVIYFHAFMESAESGSALAIREAYVLRGDHNVILVDAQRLKAGPWYLTAAENTWYIGRFVAHFIDYLVSRGLDLSKTHLVGHSLGAQSAGVAGATLTSGRVARITGLDPALPLFSNLPDVQRLDASDADFVDVIHTDAGIFGVQNSIGHVDFYPNGGISPQPGCELEIIIPRQMLLEKFFCSHWRSYQFYAESVLRPFSFLAAACPSWKHFTSSQCSTQTHMGFRVDPESGIDHKPHKGYKLFDLLKGNSKIQTFKYPKKYTTSQYTKTGEAVKGGTDKEKPSDQFHDDVKVKTLRRRKRFLPLFNRQESNEQDGFLIKMLNFLIKNRKNFLPVVSVMKEINTLVKSVNGELNHVTKETNNYIGNSPPVPAPVSFNLELGSDPPGKTFLKRLLGVGTQTDKLTVATSGGGLFG